MNDLTNESYVIFLDNKYFKKSFFSSIYKKIKDDLENKGIKVVPIKEIIERQSNNESELSFDNKKFPDVNTLYIHLFNGQYYNDSIYSKRKTEKEREMLLLIAGKLGVKESTYSTEITEIKIKKFSGGVNIQSVDSSIGYEKQIVKSVGQSGKEIYLNRGAPAYLNSKSTIQVANNLKDTIGEMKSKVFSYDYFIKNPKLESFVHKRFAFKMLKLEYTIEEEDLTDLSFGVKACFFKYGINLEFNETILSREKLTYTFEFYNDQELMIKFNERDLEFSDDFVKIRLTYDSSDNKQISINHICDYVLEESKKCFYRPIGSTQYFSFYNKLNDWIISEPYEKFIEVCKGFFSTIQIKNWIYRTLSNDQIEIIHLDKNNNEIKKDVVSNVQPIKETKTELKKNKASWYRTNSFCIKENDLDYDISSDSDDSDNVVKKDKGKDLKENDDKKYEELVNLYKNRIDELALENSILYQENVSLNP